MDLVPFAGFGSEIATVRAEGERPVVVGRLQKDRLVGLIWIKDIYSALGGANYAGEFAIGGQSEFPKFLSRVELRSDGRQAKGRVLLGSDRGQRPPAETVYAAAGHQIARGRIKERRLSGHVG